MAYQKYYALLDSLEKNGNTFHIVFDAVSLEEHRNQTKVLNYNLLETSLISTSLTFTDIKKKFNKVKLKTYRWYELTVDTDNNLGAPSEMMRNLNNDTHEDILLAKVHLIKEKTKLHKELSKTYRLENITHYENCIANEKKIMELIPKVPKEGFYIKIKDVGQGSCNSFCRLDITDSGNIARPEEFLYLACGGGVTANKKTYPNDIEFNPQENALNILCHWDMDHWISAEYKPKLKNQVNWLVPNQSPIGISHLKLASELSKNNRLFIWPANLSSISTNLVDIHKLKQHKNRNYSGLVVIAKSNSDSSGKDFFYSGDAAFKHCRSFIDKYKLRIITIPHHGGRMPKQNIPQAPDEHLAICSYGKENTFGHPFEKPNSSTKSIYSSLGWTNWLSTTRGSVNIYPLPLHEYEHIDCMDFVSEIMSVQLKFN